MGNQIARVPGTYQNNDYDPVKASKQQQKETEQRILTELAKLGGRVFDDDDITYEGEKLILPTTMTLEQAIKFLQRKAAELEKETNFSRTFQYRPLDGGYCMWQAFKKVFGAVMHRGHLNMFGKEMPPQMITVNIDVGQQEQIPWGRFEIPMMPGMIFSAGSTQDKNYGNLFTLQATGPKKWKNHVEGIFKLVQEELETASMYRGKAFDGQGNPEFLDLSAVSKDKVVYSQEVMAQLEANVWAGLRHTAKFEELGIPLKRAVLIHGPYGTGKTLAAGLTGQEAVANGWTFIQARPGRDELADVLQTARLYQPSVVFYEDVDQIAAPVAGDHSGIARLLDDFDGISAKGTRILVVLTTNHPERIHKGMARPGRLDAMIEINELDAAGVEKLVRTRIAPERLADDVDWNAVFEAALEYKPAFVTEFADRTMRYVLARTNGEIENTTITTDDLVYSAQGLRPQFQKMTDAKDTPDRDPLTAQLGRIMGQATEQALERVIQPDRDYNRLIDAEDREREAEILG